MSETSHLNSLQVRLSNEKSRLSSAQNKNEKELRQVWVNQLEKEIQNEIKFLESKGIKIDTTVYEMSDDELLAEFFD